MNVQSVGFDLPTANKLLGRVSRYLTRVRAVLELNMFTNRGAFLKLKRKDLCELLLFNSAGWGLLFMKLRAGGLQAPLDNPCKTAIFSTCDL